MEHPVIQNAIRLIDFTVTGVEMSAVKVAEMPEDNSIKINLGLHNVFDKDEKHYYVTRFTIAVSDQLETFSLKLTAEARFETKEEINEDFIASDYVAVNSPAIAFPFVRSFINTLTLNAGLRAVILPAFNFAAMKKKEKPTEK